MRTPLRFLVPVAAAAAAVLVAAAAIVAAPRSASAAPGIDAITPTEGPLQGVSFVIDGHELPRRAKVWFVESGVESPRRYATKLRGRNDRQIRGVVRGKLTPDQVYDVVAQARGGDSVALATAFTARAPRFTELTTTSAAVGEQVVAVLDFASARTRIFVDAKKARVIDAGRTDGRTFRFLVPSRVAVGTDVDVTATDGPFQLDAPSKLSVLYDRRIVKARANRAWFTSWDQGYTSSGGEVVVSGGAEIGLPGRTMGSFLTIRLPVDLGSASLPATFTQADGGSVEWFSTSGGRPGMPGPRGRYVSGTYTVRVEALDGQTLHGTFEAQLTDVTGGDRRRDLVLTGGSFDVDPRPAGD